MVPKLSTTIQYLFIRAVSYILAGTPLSRFLFGAHKQDPPKKNSFEKSASLVISEDNLTCPHHAYNVHIFSRDPLIIYI
jgi:prolyl 4-hydroxylase